MAFFIKLITGKVSGYRAEFHAPWSEFSKSFQTEFKEHKLLSICINIPHETAVNGSDIWLNAENIYTSEKNALNKIKEIKKMMIKTRTEEIAQNQAVIKRLAASL